MTATFTTDDPQEMQIIANISDIQHFIFDLNNGNIERKYIKHADISEEYEKGFRHALEVVRIQLTTLNHIG
jgi:hypothetical protein